MVVEDIFLENGSFHPMSEGYNCCLEDEQEIFYTRTSLFQPGEKDRE